MCSLTIFEFLDRYPPQLRMGKAQPPLGHKICLLFLSLKSLDVRCLSDGLQILDINT